ncbi:ATPase [Clostridium botulinum]|uniref:DUF5906 domain-containing protein n=1 Tax=Clostridium botulinum TaxID=1491 RepID=UPI002246E1DB|nr:DUF5906 domain-containing protein [Clostridium botulinum]UZP02837.1 ATPase [Clostridium botulinum]UZP06195.1 ATPase [Clostridium botulinum]UZP09576.1 ATPase [Clostridium botulinum]
MRLIKFTLEEMEICFSALAYMFADDKAREEYKNLLLDNKMEFPNTELDIISDTLKNYQGTENMFLNFEVVKNLSKLEQWSNLKDYSQLSESQVYYTAFISKIKGNKDKLEDIPLIKYSDNKQAFISFINGNLRALINSVDKNKFAYWNSKAWELLTEEETYMVYGNFITQCNLELRQNINVLEKQEYSEICKRMNKWDTDRNARECLNKVKRDKQHIINMKNYIDNRNLICSHDGKIINLANGEIRAANRNDLILFTSKYNLMDKGKAVEFMQEKMKIYLDIIGEDRLLFILDLISYKLLDRSLQSAIFMIGTRATGKSTFKNIMKDLFKNENVVIPYNYLTTSHKGNDDKSRDDILASLDNKRIAFCSEGEDEQTISSARFKTLLSNSEESARKTGKELMEVNLKGLDIIFDTNSIPSFSTMDGAISRRLMFVKFDKPISIEKRNADYYKEEIAPNFDYVFSYFVYRAIAMIGKKLEIPQCIKDDTSLKLSEVDSLLNFSREAIAPFDGGFVKYSELENEYIRFCENEGQKSVIPEVLQDAKKYSKRCNYIINLLKEKDGYCNIYKGNRVSDGSHNSKTYLIHGLTFLDNTDSNPFEDIKTFKYKEPKEEQQTLPVDNIQPKEIEKNAYEEYLEKIRERKVE